MLDLVGCRPTGTRAAQVRLSESLGIDRKTVRNIRRRPPVSSPVGPRAPSSGRSDRRVVE